MKFSIKKPTMKIGGGLKLGKKTEVDNVQKSENDTENKLEKTSKLEPRAVELPELGQSLSSFITISHLDYQDDYPVYTGIVTDPTAHGGKRFMVIEPTFTAKDRKSFETIRQILMVELT
ncbi:MAG: hypothetical protein HYZ56_03145, partial [Nitrosopumilales archaeon]|nr:hypothetical protein [Nitrosopumilales archaeon]